MLNTIKFNISNMGISERIKERMEALQIKQADIVRTIRASKGTVSLWIKGETVPSGENLVKLARVLDRSPEWLQTGRETSKALQVDYEHNADFVGVAKSFRPVPVVGTAKLGDDGDYSLEQVDANVVLDAPTSDPNACALRVVGDSMHPAIRHGWYVVIEPSIDPRHGLYVAVETHSGKRMVKELLSMDSDVVRLESVNPKHGRTTLDAKEVKTVQAVTMIVQASKARVVG